MKIRGENPISGQENVNRIPDKRAKSKRRNVFFIGAKDKSNQYQIKKAGFRGESLPAEQPIVNSNQWATFSFLTPSN